MSCHTGVVLKVNWWLFWLIVLMLGLRPPAAPAVELNETVKFYSLGRHLSVLKDQSGALDFEQISAPALADRFMAGRREILNFGFTRAAYWVRFTLQNNADTPQSYLLEVGFPLIDQVDLYRPAAGGTYELERAGELIPVRQRPIAYHNPVFPLTVAPGQSRPFYVRYQDKGSVAFPLRLWQPAAFAEKVANERLGLGLYYGAMLIMFFYNLIIYLTVKNRSYVYYVIYLSCYLLWQISYNGLAGEFLWPDQPWLTNQVIPFFICGSAIAAIQFTRTFLATKENVPGLDRLLTLLMLGFTIDLVWSLHPDYTVSVLLSAIFAAIFAVLVIITGIRCWRMGYRPARYFSIAWFLLLCGTAILAVKSLGLLPSNFFTEYALQAGSILEIVLLSLALADQVNVMKQEKEQAQAAALQIQEAARQHLEIEVRDRTRELQANNQQLANLSAKLAKYLSPQVYKSIFAGKTEVKLNACRKRLTIFFSDIKGFTSLTDHMEPEALTDFLNGYLDEMAEIALRYGGTIDKFIGDAIMIFFGDPESKGEKADALACVEMAIEMRERVARRPQPWRRADYSRPLQIRMGINTGYCTVGNIGTEDRLDYTIIGAPVNVASRLEAQAEPNAILISAATQALIKDRVACVEKGELTLKGLTNPVQVFQVQGRVDPAARPALVEEEGDGYAIMLDLDRMSLAARKKMAGSLVSVLGRLVGRN